MKFFIVRPIFASVIALIMVFAGTISIFLLPVAQYPPVVPPQIQVTTQYIGASSEVVADTVTTPLEEKINGTAGMIYMASNSTNNGDSIITVTFEVGFDQDIAQVEVLNRANQAVSELPMEAQQVGVTVSKSSPNILLAVNLTSPNGSRDGRFLQNYADIHVTDALSRIPGVATVTNFGLAKYAMRIWLDPAKLANLGLTGNDVSNAISEQNQQVAAGKVGSAPAPEGQAMEFQLTTKGRLNQVEEFENIVIRALDNGSLVRVKDVARVELGAETYAGSTRLSGKDTATIGIFQLADANGLTIKKEVEAIMADLADHFPEDVAWALFYDTTTFMRESIKEVVITLLMAIVLVFIVVYLFLQNLRSALIPTIAIPVSLIGTFAVMQLFGFSINSLSMLGLVLAVALVVDDAIVIVENVARRISESGGSKSLQEMTTEALEEVRGPIIATTLVLLAVFVPMGFLPGLTGQLYNQFAITVAIAVAFSGINSLTLSPALSAVLLRPEAGRENAFFRGFNKLFQAISDGYGAAIHWTIKIWPLMLLIFAGLCAAAVYAFTQLPHAFVPEEDQGYFVVIVELPDGATITRTESVMAQVTEIALATEGVANVVEVSGYSVVDSYNQPNSGAEFVILDPWDQRDTPETSIEGIIGALDEKLSAIPGAIIIAVNAPPIPGLSSTGGMKLEVQDLNAAGIERLNAATQQFIAEASKRPEVGRVFTTFDMNTPQRYLEIDREKAKTRGVSLTELFDTLQINMGSLYVNQFNKFGKVYRVYLQAQAEDRANAEDVLRLQVRNDQGDMIPLSSFVTIKPITGPYNVPHYNKYTAIPVGGIVAPGYSGGDAVKAFEEVAENLPEGFGTAWTEVVYQQIKAGAAAPIVFALSLVFVFLVLAAQYESWSMPFMVLATIPLGLLGAAGLLLLRGLHLDVYAQIGLVMLIGLVAKNAILIVEFAKDQVIRGDDIVEAAAHAARMRLRPILMTALAFIVGLMPLVVASGAGANARQSLGTTVVGGLALATILIIFVPLFFILIERLRFRTSGHMT